MKKIFLLLLLFIVHYSLFNGSAAAQDPPSGYTTNFRFRLYDEGAYPTADSVNQNYKDIDAAIKNVQKSRDTLKDRYSLNFNYSNGTFKTAVIDAYATTNAFFKDYFYKYTPGGESPIQWALKIDLTQFDNDTLKILPGIFAQLSTSNTYTGANTFQADVTFGNGTGATINYSIANDLGSVLWKINGTTVAKWDEADGQYFQFLYTVDVTGDITYSGYLKPPSHTDAGAPNGSIYYSSTQGALVFKDNSGSVRVLY